MDRLNEILHELGISKVKLAKFLGVSRQMIYNYLELDDLNKWPKDKKVLLMNLLGIKNADEIDFSTVFYFNIAFSLLIYVVFFFGAGLYSAPSMV